MSSTASELLINAIPDLDDAVTSYVDALMTVNDGDDPDDDALGQFLLPLINCEIDLKPEERQKLIEELEASWKVVQEQRGHGENNKYAARKLERAQKMQSGQELGRTSRLQSGVDIESGVKARETQVDIKKLEKAEAKLAAKRERRQRRNAYESSRLVDAAKAQKSYEELFLQVNPLAASRGSKGKSRDVHLTNIELSFGSHRILSGASVSFAHGQRYGIVGRNGIGKSTLLKAMALREVNIPAHVSVLYVEQEVTAEDTPAIDSVLSADVHRTRLLAREKELNEQLASIESQAASSSATKEADSSESNSTEKDSDKALSKEALLHELGEVQQYLVDIDADSGPKRAAELLNGLGFSSEDQQRPTKAFSGGWRMRLSLARALFVQPDLLLLDEPSNNLDLNALAWLEDYLTTEWKNTLVVVSHDRAFLDSVATSIVHQHSERLDTYKGNFTQFYATRTERARNQRREYEAQLEYRQHLQAFIDRWRYNAKRAPQAQSRIKILEKLPELEPPEDDEVVSFSFAEADKLSPPVLQLDDVAFGYTPEKPLLQHVNFKVDLDSRIGLIGPNGAGKSTLLKVLIDQLHPTHGVRQAHGRLRIGYFAQHHIDGLDLDVNPVVYLARMFPGRSETEYRAHLGQFGITGMTGLQIMSTLSGGQKSRVAFAALSLQRPHILLLDEPTNHLDIEGLDALMEALSVWNGGVVVVSHDTTFINTVCKELFVCADGRCDIFKGDVSSYKDIIVANAKTRPT